MQRRIDQFPRPTTVGGEQALAQRDGFQHGVRAVFLGRWNYDECARIACEIVGGAIAIQLRQDAQRESPSPRALGKQHAGMPTGDLAELAEESDQDPAFGEPVCQSIQCIAEDGESLAILVPRKQHDLVDPVHAIVAAAGVDRSTCSRPVGQRGADVADDLNAAVLRKGIAVGLHPFDQVAAGAHDLVGMPDALAFEVVDPELVGMGRKAVVRTQHPACRPVQLHHQLAVHECQSLALGRDGVMAEALVVVEVDDVVTPAAGFEVFEHPVAALLRAMGGVGVRVEVHDFETDALPA
ncbi:MAG: hypothetical protein NVV60_08955 [Luteimonas sp.]|nr:hypothetical protein [Luteimonas sp.]